MTDSTLEGIAPWAQVFEGDKSLDGQVFALEILERPLGFERSAGRTRMILDRSGCREGIYTTRGKGNLVKRSITDLAAAQAEDKALHRFLLSKEDGDFEVVHQGLRWASGGVLPIVTWRGREWIPFFFRDIPPFGWNISLGGSDKGDDLSRPERFIEREFLEEMLVLEGAPVNNRARMRPLIMDGQAPEAALSAALAHAGPHLQLRAKRDGLEIDAGGEPITVGPAQTSVSARITRGAETHDMDNVLVCVNRLEAAIEVVRALHFELNDDALILDGELLEPVGSASAPDLIRMPVAMISCDYLRGAFGPAWSDFSHEGTLQPSVRGPAIPATEIVMFENDVIRRREIRDGADADATPFERERYADWTTRFGEHFYDAQGRPSIDDPVTLFTLPATKIISYYFAHSQ